MLRYVFRKNADVYELFAQRMAINFFAHMMIVMS